MNCSARPRYLHPNYNYYYEQQQQQEQIQKKGWNKSASSNYNNYCTPQRYAPPPVSSPGLGLKEVLSSYTRGPTLIMIEKKRKPSYFENKNVRLAGILLVALLGCYIVGSSLHSNEKPYFELKSEPILAKLVAEEQMKSLDPSSLSPNGPFEKDDNLSSGYTYLNNHHKYASVILSLDDDEESYVEDIQSYTFL